MPIDSVVGGTHITVTGSASDPIVNLDAAITGSVNGVTLLTDGPATEYLNQSGTYTVPELVTAGNGIDNSTGDIAIQTVSDSVGDPTVTIYVSSLADLPTAVADEIIFDAPLTSTTLVFTGAFDLGANTLIFDLAGGFFNINGYNDVAASLTSSHPDGTIQVNQANFFGINSVGIQNTGTNSRPIKIDDPTCTFFFLNGSAFDLSSGFTLSAEILILQYSDVFIRDTLIRGGIKFEFDQPTSFGRINNCRFNGPEATPAIEFDPDVTADSLDILDCRFEIPASGIGIQVEDPADIALGTLEGCNFTLADATSVPLKSDPVSSSFIEPAIVSIRGMTEDDDGNIIYADDGADEIRRLVGKSATQLDFIDSPDGNVWGIAWVDGNLVSSDFGTGMISVHDGFSDVILDTFDFPGAPGSARDIAWTGSSLLTLTSPGLITELDGLSADALQSFNISIGNARGIAFDGRNLIVPDSDDDEICIFEGISDVEKYRFPGPDTDMRGVTWIEGGFAVNDNTSDRIYFYDHFITFDQGSPSWSLGNNTNVSDSRDQFCVRAFNNADTSTITTLVQDEWHDIAAADLFYNLLLGVEAFSMLDPLTGEIEYIGTRTKSFPLSIEIACLGAGGVSDIEMGFSLNDESPSLTSCGVSGAAVSNTQRTSTTSPGSPVMLSTGDTIKPQIRNISNASNITINESKITGFA